MSEEDGYNQQTILELEQQMMKLVDDKIVLQTQVETFEHRILELKLQHQADKEKAKPNFFQRLSFRAADSTPKENTPDDTPNGKILSEFTQEPPMLPDLRGSKSNHSNEAPSNHTESNVPFQETKSQAEKGVVQELRERIMFIVEQKLMLQTRAEDLEHKLLELIASMNNSDSTSPRVVSDATRTIENIGDSTPSKILQSLFGTKKKQQRQPQEKIFSSISSDKMITKQADMLDRAMTRKQQGRSKADEKAFSPILSGMTISNQGDFLEHAMAQKQQRKSSIVFSVFASKIEKAERIDLVKEMNKLEKQEREKEEQEWQKTRASVGMFDADQDHVDDFETESTQYSKSSDFSDQEAALLGL